jgi:hypothetical protein
MLSKISSWVGLIGMGWLTACGGGAPAPAAGNQSGNADPVVGPNAPLEAEAAPAPVCRRAEKCCRAFWDAHEVLPADITPDEIDCHETRNASDTTCEDLIDDFKRRAQDVIDVSRQPSVRLACD